MQTHRSYPTQRPAGQYAIKELLISWAGNRYDRPGANHLAVGVPAQADIDAVADYLTEYGVELRFETLRHQAEFTNSPKSAYML